MQKLYIPPKEKESERNSLDLPLQVSKEILDYNMVSDLALYRSILKLPITFLEKFILGKLCENNLIEKDQLKNYVTLNGLGRVIFILLKNKNIHMKEIHSFSKNINIELDLNQLSNTIEIIRQYFTIKILSIDNNNVSFKIIRRNY